MSEELESEGKSVTEAVDSALKKMGLRRDQVEVQILQEASSGILGFGAKPARVKITRKHWGTPAPETTRGPAMAGRISPRRPSQSAAARTPGRPPRPPRPQSRPEPARPAPSSAQAPAREQVPMASAPVQQRRAPEPRMPAPRQAEIPQPEREPVKPADPAQACAAAEDILKELLNLMLFADTTVATRWDPEQERVKANVRLADSERLIGPEGKVLEALQFVMTLLVSRRMDTPVAVQVDTGDYWQRKENEVLSLALKGIESVRNTGRPFRLQPMEAPMRRLIHRSLANHPDIMTASEGDGPWRKVVLRPRS